MAALDAASELPVSVDLENGYDASADGAAAAIRRGGRGRRGGRVDRGLGSRRAADLRLRPGGRARGGGGRRLRADLGFPFTFTARAENHIRGRDDLDDTIARLQAFERAGADVLYAPGLRTVDEIRTVCDAVSKPVNVLAVPSLSLAEMAEAGAQRVSVGGALTWVAVKAAADAAERDARRRLLGARRESPGRRLARELTRGAPSRAPRPFA